MVCDHRQNDIPGDASLVVFIMQVTHHVIGMSFIGTPIIHLYMDWTWKFYGITQQISTQILRDPGHGTNFDLEHIKFQHCAEHFKWVSRYTLKSNYNTDREKEAECEMQWWWDTWVVHSIDSMSKAAYSDDRELNKDDNDIDNNTY